MSRRASKSAAITLLGNVASPLSSLLVAPALAQGLGVDGRGEVAAAIAPLMLAITIGTVGLPEALTYFVARREATGGHLVKALFATTLAGGALVAAIWAAAPVLSADDPALSALMRLAIFIVIPGLACATIRGVAMGRHMWTRVALERGLAGLVRVIAVFGLLLADNLGPVSATLALSLPYFIGALVYAWPWPPSQPVSRAPRFRLLLNYGSALWVGSLTGILLGRIDQLLMTPLAGTYQLGLYAVAVNVSEVVLIANAAIREVVFALESERSDGQRLAQASRISTIITFAIALPIALGAPAALPMIFGDEFAPALPLVWVLLAAIVMGNPGSVAGTGLGARGRPGLRSLSLTLATLINVALIFILVPTMGAMGAAIATLVGNLVSSNLNILWLRRVSTLRGTEFYAFSGADVRKLLRDFVSLFRRS